MPPSWRLPAHRCVKIKMSKPNHFAIWRQIVIYAHAQVFLDLARVIFEQQTSVEFTVLKILVNFLLLIECKRAQVRLKAFRPTL